MTFKYRSSPNTSITKFPIAGEIPAIFQISFETIRFSHFITVASFHNSVCFFFASLLIIGILFFFKGKEPL